MSFPVPGLLNVLYIEEKAFWRGLETFGVNWYLPGSGVNNWLIRLMGKASIFKHYHYDTVPTLHLIHIKWLTGVRLLIDRCQTINWQVLYAMIENEWYCLTRTHVWLMSFDTYRCVLCCIFLQLPCRRCTVWYIGSSMIDSCHWDDGQLSLSLPYEGA